jgi:glycosyltransferase involved in cell wall biosynthesis
VVSQYYWPEVFPINMLCEALAEKGHDVHVLTGMPNYPTGVFETGYGWLGPFLEHRLGVTISRVPLVPRGVGSRFKLVLNYISFFTLSLVAAPFRSPRNPDIVLANQASPLIAVAAALLIAKLRNRPLVIWVQDLWPESLRLAGITSPWLYRAMDAFMKMVYRRSALVFVQSRAFVAHARRYGVAPERVVYLPNWPDARFRPLARDAASIEIAEMPEGFRVVFAGNIGEAQAIETILEAAQLLRRAKNIRIIMIGDGRQRRWLQDEIKRRDLSSVLSYLGFRPFERMPLYYAAADALLVSLRKNSAMADTIPSRLQACMASGRPIIASIDGEAQHVVREAGAGFVAPAEDAAALADAIERMASLSDAERSRFAEGALQYAATEFSQAVLLERVEAAFKAVLETEA